MCCLRDVGDVRKRYAGRVPLVMIAR